MIRALGIRRAGFWHGAADNITLDYDHRHRRRVRLSHDAGDIMLDLPAAVHIRDGDALVLEGGGLVAVHAAAESLLEIGAPDAATLTRLAWHLGNRHLAVQFLPECLRILHDHVIAGMVAGLGGTAVGVTAAFDPEQGAYAHG